jgi:hypothetical protein
MLTFPGQREGEKIIMVIRKHPIVYMRIMAVFIICVLMPIVIFYAVAPGYGLFGNYSNINITINLFICAYLLYGMLLTVIALMNEQFDLFILTDQRLIDYTQVSFLEKTVSSTPLQHIQDTTSSITGFLQTLFNYGAVDVQTAAGSASTFNIDRVPDPNNIAKIILNSVRLARPNKPISGI